jgi:hypothetical protein
VSVSEALENYRILNRNPAQAKNELRQRKTTRKDQENLNRLGKRGELPQVSGGS